MGVIDFTAGIPYKEPATGVLESRGQVACTACRTKVERASSHGIRGGSLCEACFHDLRDYCRSFGERMNHDRVERWMGMVAPTAAPDQGLGGAFEFPPSAVP